MPRNIRFWGQHRYSLQTCFNSRFLVYRQSQFIGICRCCLYLRNAKFVNTRQLRLIFEGLMTNFYLILIYYTNSTYTRVASWEGKSMDFCEQFDSVNHIIKTGNDTLMHTISLTEAQTHTRVRDEASNFSTLACI